jgi:hypothetical protein
VRRSARSHGRTTFMYVAQRRISNRVRLGSEGSTQGTQALVKSDAAEITCTLMNSR